MLHTLAVANYRSINNLALPLGQTCIRGQGLLDEPPWHWPD